MDKTKQTSYGELKAAPQDAVLGSGMQSQLLRLGNNVDQINLYARLKDFYKLFEVGSLGASTLMGVKALQQTNEWLPKQVEWQHGANFGRVADGANTILQGGLSYYGKWLDEQSAVRTYKKLVQEELSLDRPVRFEDLKHSHNPIIRDTANYYSKKAWQRAWPDTFGLVRFVPLVAKAVGGEKAYEATKVMEMIPGTSLGLGMKSFFFSWYFTSRQTGAHYELMRIWNKTEGISEQPNRAVNQGVNPGELVTSEDITALYEAYRKDYDKRDFTVDDPLTGRLFEQIARHLNYNYIPKLYADKRPDLFDTELNPEVGRARWKDLEGTHLTHARLVEFIGSGGFDIDNTLATAIRLEVMSRHGVDAYNKVSTQLKNIQRPSSELPPEEYKSKLLNYLDQLNQVAHQALGNQWPPYYVEKRISTGILDSYHDHHAADNEFQEQIKQSFSKYKERFLQQPNELLENTSLEKKFADKAEPRKLPEKSDSFKDAILKGSSNEQGVALN